MSATHYDRFMAKVEPIPLAGCWLWTGAITPAGYGYGSFRLDGRAQFAHRVAYRLFVGDIPDGLMVCHRCDIGICVAPPHLFLGTNSINMLDAVAKGRNGQPQGCEHPRAKVDDDMVRAIRCSVDSNGVLAERYGLSKPQIIGIKKRRYWRHLA